MTKSKYLRSTIVNIFSIPSLNMWSILAYLASALRYRQNESTYVARNYQAWREKGYFLKKLSLVNAPYSFLELTDWQLAIKWATSLVIAKHLPACDSNSQNNKKVDNVFI